MNEKHLTNYEEWEKNVPEEIKQESVWDFYAYRKALFLFDLCWIDCEKLMQDRRGQAVADQLIRCVGSISANIEEGYGRGFGGKEYQQFLRYAIGSAKEAKGWYFRGRHLLSAEVVKHRLQLLSEVSALIITEISRQRKKMNK